MIYGGIRDTDPSKWDWYRGANLFLHTLVSTLYEKGTSAGYSIVLDMEGFKIGHLSTLSISYVRNVLYFVQVIKYSNCDQLHMLYGA